MPLGLLPTPTALPKPNTPVLVPVASPPFRPTLTLPAELTKNTSRSPSPSTSPTAMAREPLPMLTSLPLLNAPVLLPVASPPFRRTLIVPSPASRSRSPSPSTSPTATHCGLLLTLTSLPLLNTPVFEPVASPPFRRTLTVPLPASRSRSPSPSTSARATLTGWPPTLTSLPLLNAPVLLPLASPPFRRTLTVVRFELAVSRSRSPSPSTSPVVTAWGVPPTAGLLPPINTPRPLLPAATVN